MEKFNNFQKKSLSNDRDTLVQVKAVNEELKATKTVETEPVKKVEYAFTVGDRLGYLNLDFIKGKDVQARHLMLTDYSRKSIADIEVSAKTRNLLSVIGWTDIQHLTHKEIVDAVRAIQQTGRPYPHPAYFMVSKFLNFLSKLAFDSLHDTKSDVYSHRVIQSAFDSMLNGLTQAEILERLCDETDEFISVFKEMDQLERAGKAIKVGMYNHLLEEFVDVCFYAVALSTFQCMCETDKYKIYDISVLTACLLNQPFNSFCDHFKPTLMVRSEIEIEKQVNLLIDLCISKFMIRNTILKLTLTKEEEDLLQQLIKWNIAPHTMNKGGKKA